MADRGTRGDQPSRPTRAERESWLQNDPFTAADDGDLPPWAGPSIHATRPGGSRLRPPAAEPDEQAQDDPAGPGTPRRRGRGRAAAARLRKSRRRVYIWCGTAIVLAVIVALVAVIHGLPKSGPQDNGFVTTLQPGEFSSVPSACSSVSPALLSQYLSGRTRKVTPGGAGATSQCSFTVDARPVFRVLDVTMEAYQPSGIPAGNGSATDNAKNAFLVAQQQLAHPGKKAPLPPAQLTKLAGLGKQAVSALQVIHASQTVTDLVTVLVRDNNVVVTVSLQAQAAGKGFGPVSVAKLRAGTLAVSHAVMAKIAAQPVVRG